MKYNKILYQIIYIMPLNLVDNILSNIFILDKKSKFFGCKF